MSPGATPVPAVLPLPQPASRAAVWWWVALLALAAFSYLYGLDGQHIPRVGDEMPYAQVTRVTAESGRWLPLRAADPHLENTKPPLLFWTGIAATDGGKTWTLWRLRLPIVLVTFTCALLVFVLGRRLAGTGTGLLSAVVFLGWSSTFRYGRPFLTNLPETLFVFAPFACAVAKPQRLERWWFWILATLFLGLACWVKSFALVAPVGLAYAWWLLARRGWRWGEFLRRDAPKLALLGLGGLGLFALWPLLDPNGQAVLDQFVGRENLGKIGSQGNYFVEMFAGRHSVWRTWFGHLFNAGLYLPLLVFLSVDALRNRRSLSEAEKALWMLVLAFLVAYTIPTHRQENYLLPTVPALAVLVALRWQSFGRHAWRLSSIFTLMAGLVGLAFAFLLMWTATHIWDEYSFVHVAVPVLVVAVSVVALVRWESARLGFPLAVLLAHLSIACVTAPFEGRNGRFDDEARSMADGATVLVPSNFRATEEAYRFLLPGSAPRSFDVAQGQARGAVALPPAEAAIAVLRMRRAKWIEFDEEMGTLPYDPVGRRRWTLVTRLGWDDLQDLLLRGRIEVLVQEEVLVKRRATPPR